MARRVATYNRFAGQTGAPSKAVTPKSFIAKEGGEEEVRRHGGGERWMRREG